MGLVEEFRMPSQTPRPWLLGVVGGRLSEGMDFPAEQLEVVVLLGLPFPRPTAYQRAFEHYCQLQFGAGWAYAVEVPTVRKVQQTIGRLIRSPEDSGVGIILDFRIARLAHGLPLLLPSAAIGPEVERFFATGRRLDIPQPSPPTVERPPSQVPDLQRADALLRYSQREGS